MSLMQLKHIAIVANDIFNKFKAAFAQKVEEALGVKRYFSTFFSYLKK